MIDSAFLLVLLAWAVAGASPGPATLAIAGTAMQRGRGAGIAIATGVICGSACWGIAALLGMSAIMFAHGWLVEIVRYVGAIYLLYLAYKAGRSAINGNALMAAPVAQSGLARQFLKGFLIHITNPKAIFAWGAMFAVVVPLDANFQTLAQTFGALILVSMIVFWGYGALFSTRSAVQIYTRLRRWFEGAFAVLFGVAGLKFLQQGLGHDSTYRRAFATR